MKNILTKVLVLVMVLVIGISTVAFADLSPKQEWSLKYYDEKFGREIEEVLKERGLFPTENLIGTVKEELKFESKMQYINKLFQSGTYEIELWDRDTVAKFGYTESDFYSLEVGAFYKNSKGELVMYTFNGDEEYNPFVRGAIIQDMVKHTLITEYIQIPEKTLKSFGNTEVYGYIKYGYSFEAGQRSYDDENYEYDSTIHVKYFKFDLVDKKAKPAKITETANPTSSKVIIDGKEVAFDAYNIKGNNYFKLRDFAYSIKDSERAFDIFWNVGLGIIEINDFSYYLPIGGEMAKGDGKSKTATLNPTPTYIGFDFKPLVVYTIGGNNYFKLRDLCKELNISVEWNGEQNAIVVDTLKPYTEEGQ